MSAACPAAGAGRSAGEEDHNEPYDHAEFDRQVTKAVSDIVAHQVAVGIDVVSDGEASKIGYATYIKERLTGPAASRSRRSQIVTWRTIPISASAWCSSSAGWCLGRPSVTCDQRP
jgi:methionine synthase II (cobalamin-independent)